MRRLLLSGVFTALLSAVVWGQWSGGNWPATCAPGGVFQQTADVYFCTSPTTWTKLTRSDDATSAPLHATRHLVNGADPIDTLVRVTGSNATTTGQVFVDVTGLSVPLAANATYLFRANLSTQTSNVTTGIRYAVGYSAAGAAIEAQMMCSFNVAGTAIERVSAFSANSVNVCMNTASQVGGVLFEGVITVGANAGNLTIRHLKVTSGTSTVFVNSALKVTRIG